MTEGRRALLEQLVASQVPPSQVVERLSKFGWDSDEELFVMTQAHMTIQLRRFVSGEIDAVWMTEWAEAIEGRDDIGFEPKHGSALRELVFELANPDLSEPLSIAEAQGWIDRLNQ